MAQINNVVVDYPFNPYGTDSTCVISDEIHTLTPANGTNYAVLVPRCAPFFRGTLTVINDSTGATLTENVGYTVGNLFNQMSQQTYKGLFGSIVINNIDAPIQVKLTYSTLGGDFVLDDAVYTEAVANVMDSARSVYWENIIDVPTEFPPIDHTHSADDTLDYQSYLDALTVALGQFQNQLDQYLSTATDHIVAVGNVHGLTKEDIQLQNVENYKAATVNDVGSNAQDLYLTLAVGRALFSYLFTGMSTLALSSDVIGEVQTAKATVELLKVFDEADMMTTTETSNYMEWKVYLANLTIKAYGQSSTTIVVPEKNGIFARLLGG